MLKHKFQMFKFRYFPGGLWNRLGELLLVFGIFLFVEAIAVGLGYLTWLSLGAVEPILDASGGAIFINGFPIALLLTIPLFAATLLVAYGGFALVVYLFKHGFR